MKRIVGASGWIFGHCCCALYLGVAEAVLHSFNFPYLDSARPESGGGVPRCFLEKGAIQKVVTDLRKMMSSMEVSKEECAIPVHL